MARWRQVQATVRSSDWRRVDGVQRQVLEVMRQPLEEVQIPRYISRISGPLLDRIDIHIEVPRLKHDELLAPPKGEPSRDVRELVSAARAIQSRRFEGTGIFVNAAMQSKQMRQHCRIEPDAEALLKTAITRLGLSARASGTRERVRILKLSGAIADLAAAPDIDVPHVAEAIQYRSLDRQL